MPAPQTAHLVFPDTQAHASQNQKSRFFATAPIIITILTLLKIKTYTKNVSAGSIHKGVRHSVLKEYKFILPERNIIDKFSLKVLPILKKLDQIQKENQKLTELRDWLLTMLMNGQVKVKDTGETELSLASEPKTKYGK